MCMLRPCCAAGSGVKIFEMISLHITLWHFLLFEVCIFRQLFLKSGQYSSLVLRPSQPFNLREKQLWPLQFVHNCLCNAYSGLYCTSRHSGCCLLSSLFVWFEAASIWGCHYSFGKPMDIDDPASYLPIFNRSIVPTYLWYKDKCQDNSSERQDEPGKDSCVYINVVIQCDSSNYHDCDNHWGDVDDQCNELWVVEHFHFHFSCTEC